jgi:hypothetical protein
MRKNKEIRNVAIAAGFNFSTSNKSNIPESFAIVPNKLELNQAVVRFERLPDTVQRDHVDWGCERALLCQWLDENTKRLASILDAPFYVVHLEGLAALSGGKRIALSHSTRYGQGQREVAA